MADPNDIKTVRLPLVGDFTSRFNATATQDQQFTNCIFESFKNSITGAQHIYVSKRPGIAIATTFATSSVQGQGAYRWLVGGGMYIVVRNNIIYTGTDPTNLTDRSATGGLITGNPFKVYFTETRPGVTTPMVVIYNPSDRKVYYSSNGTVWANTATNVLAGTGGIAFLDTYMIVADAFGQIYNSNIDDPTTWNPVSVLTPTMWPGTISYITKQRNNIIVFGDRWMQVFIDAAITPGSPFQNVEQLTYQVGIPIRVRDSVATGEDTTFFIGNSLSGSLAVWMLVGQSDLQQISTPAVNRSIDNEVYLGGSQALTVQGNYCRLQGKHFYILSLTNTNTIWVYDIDLQIWSKWALFNSNGGNYMIKDVVAISNVDASANSGILLLVNGLSNTVTRFVWLNSLNAKDEVVNFPMTIQTSRFDMGTTQRKFCHRIELVGDSHLTGNGTDVMTITYSDDDYSTFSNPRTIDLTLPRQYLKGLGQFRRRIWNFNYTGPSPARWEAIEMDISLEDG